MRIDINLLPGNRSTGWLTRLAMFFKVTCVRCGFDPCECAAHAVVDEAMRGPLWRREMAMRVQRELS